MFFLNFYFYISSGSISGDKTNDLMAILREEMNDLNGGEDEVEEEEEGVGAENKGGGIGREFSRMPLCRRIARGETMLRYRRWIEMGKIEGRRIGEWIGWSWSSCSCGSSSRIL